MASGSRIEWTDNTWNPVTGCTRASEGCDNCYAVRVTRRLEAMGKEKYAGLVAANQKGDHHFNGVVKCHEDALMVPFRWKKPSRIFVCSMSDLFHRDVPFEFVDKVFAIMALCPQHTFQVLTKRPDRMAEYFESPNRTEQINDTITLPEANDGFADVLPESVGDYLDAIDFQSVAWPLPNVWIGTTCENQEQAYKRIPPLLRCPAVVRYLSVEPIIGPVDLDGILGCTCRVQDRANSCKWCQDGPEDCRWFGGKSIDWVICGGESGPKARPMHPDWARSLRDQCHAAGVPFFYKQWGEWVPERPATSDDLLDARRQVIVRPDGQITSGVLAYGADAWVMSRVGKKAAGRLLDGRTWDEFPEVTA